MFRTCFCIVLLSFAWCAPVAAGGNTDLVHSYELIPANPAPNTPFELHIVHDGELLLDISDTTVVINGNRVEIVLDFFT